MGAASWEPKCSPTKAMGRGPKNILQTILISEIALVSDLRAIECRILLFLWSFGALMNS